MCIRSFSVKKVLNAFSNFNFFFLEGVLFSSCRCSNHVLTNTLVNTQIFAEDILTVLRYIRCTDFENGLIFAELALVFEINAFFMKILLT